jgi:hypothetical protein
MNHKADKRQALRDDDHMNGDVQNGDRGDISYNATPHAVLNWAWVTTQGHYDWMDSHAPFASLD